MSGMITVRASGEFLGLQLVHELIEPIGVDTRLEGEGVGFHLETGQPRRLAPSAEAAPQGIVHDGLHAPVGTPHLLLQELLDVGFDRQSGSHGGILMRMGIDIKMRISPA